MTEAAGAVSPLVIDILYSIEDGAKSVIKTNVKRERLADVLGDYMHMLMTRVGVEPDNRTPNQQNEYHITIKLDLRDDSFATSSDTGNGGLTDGIVMDVVQNLALIRVEDL